MSSQELVPRHQPGSPERRARVDGELTASRDELVIRLHPTVTVVGTKPRREREPLTVVTRPLPQPLAIQSTTHQHPARWVFDQEAITALLCFALTTTFLVALWVVVP